MRGLTDYRPIETAPRDGTVIEVTCPGKDGPYRMRWNSNGFNPLVSKKRGIWETERGDVTWCEDDGLGPTQWRPA